MQTSNLFFAVRFTVILAILTIAAAVVTANAGSHLPDCKADANCFSQLVASPTNVATAESDDNEIRAFKGFDSVYVLIEPIDDDCPQLTNAEDSFKTQIELKLRQNGIKVVSWEEWLESTEIPWIYSNVGTLQLQETKDCFGSVSLELKESVNLKRNGALILGATTWDKGYIWLSSPDRVKEDVKNIVDEKMDQFLNAYFRANPRP